MNPKHLNSTRDSSLGLSGVAYIAPAKESELSDTYIPFPGEGKLWVFEGAGHGRTIFGEEAALWKPAGVPGTDPVPPDMIVHDIMEHFPDKEFNVEGEFMAIGAAHFIRGSNFFEGTTNLQSALIPPAFHMLFKHIFAEDLSLPEELPMHPKVLTLSGLSQIEATKYMALDYLTRSSGLCDSPSKRERAREFLDTGFHWMVFGYLEAQERYRGT